MQHSPLKKAQAGTLGNLTYWLFGAVMTGFLASLVLVSTTHAAAPLWDISGAWSLDFVLSSDLSHRYHAMNVTSFNAGTGDFSGTGDTTGTVMPPAPILFTWAMTGNESGNALTATLAYNEIPGYAVTLTGTVDSSTAMSGTWTDNAGNSGTWTGAGTAVLLTSDVSGRKFEDLDGNGIMDGSDAGLPDWTIVAAEPFQTFSVDSNDTVGVTSNALASGEIYLVRVGSTYDAGDSITADAKYSVRAPNVYWTDSVQNYTSFGPDLLDLQLDGASPDWGPYNANHVYWMNVLGEGAGLTFKINDIGYPNVGSLTVDIYRVIAQTLTDADGLYALTSIPSMDFIVAEIPQTGWLQTLPTPLGYYPVTAVGTYTNYDFGNQLAPSISGMKFDDLNGNGIKEAGEPGLPDWRIRMRDMTTNLVTTRDTDADGKYAFENLPPGQYRLTERQEDGWVQTLPTSPNRYDVTLAQGQQEIDGDFGNFKLFEIHGFKYEDVDGSGAYDAGEPLLENWEITLTTPTTTHVVLTDINGAFSFQGLGPGLYTLTETLQPGWGQSEPSDGFWEIPGESGAVLAGANFGNYRFASISGRKYQDNNFNGVRNAGEPFLGNWTIELISLRDGSRQTATTKPTNPNKGSYAFTGLRPGSYLVREILQRGWLPVNPPTTYRRVTVMSDQALEDVDFGNNTIRNYAIWRISNPSAFISPLTIQGNEAVVPLIEGSPEGNAAVPPNPPTINILPKDPPLPPGVPPTPPEIELPKVPTEPPVNGKEIARKVFESIKRWLPNNF